MKPVEKIALYSTDINRSFDCLIPKKKTDGYLKSCMGYHNPNEESRFFDDEKPKGAGDICDLDGYLNIELSMSRWDDGFNGLIEGIKKTLSETFPYITGWKEVPFAEVARISLLPTPPTKSKKK